MATVTLLFQKYDPRDVISMRLEAELASAEGKFVKKGTADDQVTVCDTQGEQPMGVIIGRKRGETIAADTAVDVLIRGIYPILSADTISAMGAITTDASGCLDNADGGDYHLGEALITSASGDYTTTRFDCTAPPLLAEEGE